MNIKKVLHPILLKLMRFKRKGKLDVEGEIKDDTPTLIVANHLCINDIPALAEAVKKHFYILVSDEDKNTFSGKLLELNGVRWVTRLDKEDRKSSKDDMVSSLKEGISFAMHPESTWNLSPNLLVLPMNYGCVDIANLSNSKIVPVVTTFTDDKRYSTIGDAYYPSSDLISSIDELRDIMATMVFEQMEKYYEEHKNNSNIYSMEIDGNTYYYEKRDSISPDYWNQHISQLYNEYARARKAPDEVREFESQFIFEPKTDDYAFFQIFNSSIRYDENGNMLIKRITSEKNGYDGTGKMDEDYGKFFGYGYNEVNYKKTLF